MLSFIQFYTAKRGETLLRGLPRSTAWWKPMGREGCFFSLGTVMYCAIRERWKPSLGICRAIYWKWVSRPFSSPSDLSCLVCV